MSRVSNEPRRTEHKVLWELAHKGTLMRWAVCGDAADKRRKLCLSVAHPVWRKKQNLKNMSFPGFFACWDVDA